MLNTSSSSWSGVPLTMAIALLVAVALNTGITAFRTVFRVGFYAPVVTSIVAIAVVWQFLLQPDGLLNGCLGWFGIHGPELAAATPTWALPSLIIMAVWRNFGTLDDHLPRRPAERAAGAARGGDGRRRQRVAALPPHHDPAAAAHAAVRRGHHRGSATCSSSRSRS